MRFAFTDDQEALRAEARRFLSERVNVRAPDRGVHATIASLGWLDPDDDALGFVERCILAEETGRALLPGAFIPTLIASIAIARCGDDDQRGRLLPDLVKGASTAAYAELSEHRASDTTLHGEATTVMCAHDASTIVARAGLRLFAVPRASVRIEDVASADLTRPAADVVVEGAAEELARADVPGVHTRAATLIAAESIGVAQASLDMAVAYASQRTQFGAPIGTFQAIKHKAADVSRAVEAARLLTYRAAIAIADDEPGHAVAVSMAKAAANEAVLLATRENIQIHGGIGVTWEHDAHLLYRRALANQTAFGETAVNRDRVALALLGEP
jgi:3-oxochol-4-en-24-oyl-CoA dehydrogenase